MRDELHLHREVLVMRDKILIIDENEGVRTEVTTILCDEYEILEAADINEAVVNIGLYGNQIAVILIDIVISYSNGFSFLKLIQEGELKERVPVIVMCNDSSSVLNKQLFEYGVIDCISQPFDDGLIRVKIDNVVKFFRHQTGLEEKIQQQTEKLQMQNKMLQIQTDFLRKTNTHIIDLLGTMAEYRNLENGEHIRRVKEFTKILAKEMMKEFPEKGLTEEKVSTIVAASPLHDIGKIAIPDTILLKPGKLTEEEFDYMKSHTLCGCEILEKINDNWSKEYGEVCKEICRYHHERYDGNGYPEGLKGNEIPLSAQIVSVADVYDALVNERVYKAAIPKDKAFRMIINGECGIFSPELLECLRNARTEMENVSCDTHYTELCV